jgi:pimeloyl-ACP methyl ester carboxylesterase
VAGVEARSQGGEPVFRNVRGAMVHTADLGAGEPALVGLAGSFGNLEIWQQPLELLHRRFRTVAYDHFGTGETHVDPALVNFDEQVALVHDVLDAFEIDRCVLAGDSSLSAVAVAAADRWPERVRGLVVVAGRVDHHPDPRTIRFVEGLRVAFDRTLDGFVDLCLPEDEEGHLRRWLHDIITRTGPERSAALVESFYGVGSRSLLPSLELPALVIHGELDAVNPVEEAHEFARLLPDAELVLLEGTGHVPTLSRPRLVADAIEGFIRRRL